MKKIVILGGVIIISLIIVIALVPAPKSMAPDKNMEDVVPKNTILVTEEGFKPKELTIQKEETITFINQTENPSWPASDPHPAHTTYPETGGCKSSTFDACKDIMKDESWSFTFNTPGTWGFHDHSRPSFRGKVIVK